MENTDYELIIIGGGPAGLTAGIYAGRARLRTLLIEKSAIGGLIAISDRVENYPGFPEGISGLDLTELMHHQAIKYGTEIIYDEVKHLKVNGVDKVVTTVSGDYHARAVIIAAGSEIAKLNIPGEQAFTGRGVSYCATCDGPLFKDRDIAVIGGGDTALTEAIFLARFASRVYVIHRREQFRASQILQEKARSESRIEFILDTIVTEIKGDNSVEEIALKNVKSNSQSSIKVAGVFISVGFKPNTDFIQGIIELDETKRIVVDVNGMMATNMPGIYAAGDIRRNSIRQVATAVGDGAVAALSAEKYIRL